VLLDQDEGMRSRGQLLLHVGPAVLYTVGVFVAGSVPMPDLGDMPGLPWDKLAHFAIFGGMLLLVMRANAYLLPLWAPSRRLMVGAATASALGGLLELHQAALPARSAELLDWVADTLGVALAAGLWWWVRRDQPNPGRESDEPPPPGPASEAGRRSSWPDERTVGEG
jgi:VanZ family protein